MDEQPIGGTWRVEDSSEPAVRGRATVRLVASESGLRITPDGDQAVVVPWDRVSVSIASTGQVVIDTARGSLWLAPGGGADAARLSTVVSEFRAAAPAPSPHLELVAGDGRLLVLYRGEDDGSEVDPAHLLTLIAADAVSRAASGWQLASMTSLPLRHAGQKIFGVQGSGYTTKAAVTCLYVRTEAPATGG